MRICVEEDCENPHLARGWCEMHYRRVYRNGHTNLLENPPRGRPNRKELKPCIVQGCHRMGHTRQLCSVHYNYFKRWGSATKAEELMEELGDRCPMCNVVLIIGGRTPNIAIDHCHKSGRIRGLLCKRCNAGLGLFKESVEALQGAIAYLNKHQGPDA